MHQIPICMSKCNTRWSYWVECGQTGHFREAESEQLQVKSACSKRRGGI